MKINKSSLIVAVSISAALLAFQNCSDVQFAASSDGQSAATANPEASNELPPPLVQPGPQSPNNDRDDSVVEEDLSEAIVGSENACERAKEIAVTEEVNVAPNASLAFVGSTHILRGTDVVSVDKQAGTLSLIADSLNIFRHQGGTSRVESGVIDGISALIGGSTFIKANTIGGIDLINGGTHCIEANRIESLVRRTGGSLLLVGVGADARFDSALTNRGGLLAVKNFNVGTVTHSSGGNIYLDNVRVNSLVLGSGGRILVKNSFIAVVYRGSSSTNLELINTTVGEYR